MMLINVETATHRVASFIGCTGVDKELHGLVNVLNFCCPHVHELVIVTSTVSPIFL